MATFDLPALFKNTFGVYINPKFEVDDLPERQEQSKLGVNYYALDKLGREYFLPVTLDGLLLPVPIISVEGAKTIVETPMVNRQGTVKELISIDDYRILIRGICLGDNGAWPEERVDELRQKWQINKALNIESVLCGIFGIDQVVLRRISFPETRGYKGMFGYQIECSSDSPFELIVQ